MNPPARSDRSRRTGTTLRQDHRTLKRVFRAFHLDEALRDPRVDTLKILRGARAFLRGHVRDAMDREEELLREGTHELACVARRHRWLRREIEAFSQGVWEYQSATGPSGGIAPMLHPELMRHVHRIETLLDLCAEEEEEGPDDRQSPVEIAR